MKFSTVVATRDRDLVIQYGISEYPLYPMPVYVSFTV